MRRNSCAVAVRGASSGRRPARAKGTAVLHGVVFAPAQSRFIKEHSRHETRFRSAAGRRLCRTAAAQTVVPCQTYRLEYKTYYEERQVTAYRVDCETVYDERQVTMYRPVFETEMRERRYRVAKPVIETSEREERYTVQKPVWDTFIRDDSYDVVKTVYETEQREQRYTVQKPVWETQEREDRYTVRRPVFETAEREEQYTVTAARHDATRTSRSIRAAGSISRSASPGPVRNRLTWQPSACVVDPATGASTYQRGGLVWMPTQMPGRLDDAAHLAAQHRHATDSANDDGRPRRHAQGARANLPLRRQLVVQKVPVQVCRMEQEERVCQIPVTVCKQVVERVEQKVPVKVCRMVRRSDRPQGAGDQLPHRVRRPRRAGAGAGLQQEALQQTIRTPRVVEKRTPVVYTYRVPRHRGMPRAAGSLRPAVCPRRHGYAADEPSASRWPADPRREARAQQRQVGRRRQIRDAQSGRRRQNAAARAPQRQRAQANRRGCVTGRVARQGTVTR